jgi:hypothetical protein
LPTVIVCAVSHASARRRTWLARGRHVGRLRVRGIGEDRGLHCFGVDVERRQPLGE